MSVAEQSTQALTLANEALRTARMTEWRLKVLDEALSLLVLAATAYVVYTVWRRYHG